MNRLKVVFFYIVIVLAVGCGTKKKSTHVSVEKSDTLVLKTEVIKAPVLNDTFTLKEICEDSTITKFEKIFVRDTDTVFISTLDNSLSVRISQQSRILSERESIIQKQKESISRLEETVKTRPDWKLVLILLGVIALLWLVPGIPSTVNKWFRRIVLRLP